MMSAIRFPTAMKSPALKPNDMAPDQTMERKVGDQSQQVEKSEIVNEK